MSGLARRAPARVLLAVLAGALLLAGCQYKGASQLPLPGGGASGPTYRVDVIFADVLDLVPQSAVHVNDVTVGAVSKVSLDGFNARVQLKIKKATVLPANTVASLRQTSLLGEKFVSLGPPPGAAPQGRLADGAVIGLDRSGRNPEFEEVFTALSGLLNGGGVEQLQTISYELSQALAGREDSVKSLLVQLNTLLKGLDDRKAEIVRALDATDRLAKTLADQKQTIATAIDDITPGFGVLANEEKDLTAMLTSLSRLGQVAVPLINATHDNTVADFQALQPILTNLAKAGSDLPNALELLVDYPFPRTVPNGIPYDYTNLKATLNVDLTQFLATLSGPPPPPPGPAASPLSVPGLRLPQAQLPAAPNLNVPAVPTAPPVGPGAPPPPAPGQTTNPLCMITGTC